MEETNKIKRGRPVGSRNKAKTPKNDYRTIKLEKQIDNSPITKVNNLYQIVNWGVHNDYCLRLLDLYNSSPTHHACIEFGVKSIIGNGIDEEALQGTDISKPNINESWDDLIRNISKDFIIYGSFAIQIIKNRNNTTFSYYHMPFEKVRFGEYDENGLISKFYVSQDWTEPVKYTPEAFENALGVSNYKVGVKYLYVYSSYSPTSTYYPVPQYIAAIESIQSEAAYQTYDYKHITNGFTSSGILQLPPVETEAEKEEIIRNVQNMFIGSDNANALLIQFSNGIEGNNITYTPFTQDNTADDYEGANNRVINRILASHSIPSRALIGMPLENAGFASEAAILKNANELYQTLVGTTNRNIIIGCVNHLLELNGIKDVDLKIKPLTFDFTDNPQN